MDKSKSAMKKGMEKVTNMDKEHIQESNKSTLSSTLPSKEQHGSMTGGPDPNLARASHTGDPTGMTGNESMGQPTNKPRP